MPATAAAIHTLLWRAFLQQQRGKEKPRRKRAGFEQALKPGDVIYPGAGL